MPVLPISTASKVSHVHPPYSKLIVRLPKLTRGSHHTPPSFTLSSGPKRGHCVSHGGEIMRDFGHFLLKTTKQWTEKRLQTQRRVCSGERLEVILCTKIWTSCHRDILKVRIEVFCLIYTLFDKNKRTEVFRLNYTLFGKQNVGSCKEVAH